MEDVSNTQEIYKVSKKGSVCLGKVAKKFKNLGISRVNLSSEEGEAGGIKYKYIKVTGCREGPKDGKGIFNGRVHIPKKLRLETGIIEGCRARVTDSRNIIDICSDENYTGFLSRFNPYKDPELKKFCYMD